MRPAAAPQAYAKDRVPVRRRRHHRWSVRPKPSQPLTTTAPSVKQHARPRRRRAPVTRPHIVWNPIPFTQARLDETAAYAERHYGHDSWRLRHPHVIVEHYTVSTTFASTYSLFSQDVPDSELHERPGTCAHFVIDRDGTIYQLVPLDVICRHTVGLNWTAIGIEHVGMSDEDILDNPRQLRASLRLTAWLMQRYHISLGNVIGHAESLASPYHHERYAAWRCQTHGDWQHADMERYRALLRRLLLRAGAKVGTIYRARPTGC